MLRQMEDAKASLQRDLVGLQGVVSVDEMQQLDQNCPDLAKARDDDAVALVKKQHTNYGEAAQAAADVKQARAERDMWRQRAELREQEIRDLNAEADDQAKEEQKRRLTASGGKGPERRLAGHSRLLGRRQVGVSGWRLLRGLFTKTRGSSADAAA